MHLLPAVCIYMHLLPLMLQMHTCTCSLIDHLYNTTMFKMNTFSGRHLCTAQLNDEFLWIHFQKIKAIPNSYFEEKKRNMSVSWVLLICKCKMSTVSKETRISNWFFIYFRNLYISPFYMASLLFSKVNLSFPKTSK